MKPKMSANDPKRTNSGEHQLWDFETTTGFGVLRGREPLIPPYGMATAFRVEPIEATRVGAARACIK